MSSVDYDIGFVVFIDVLGWSDAIERSVSDLDLRCRMASVQLTVQERISEILSQGTQQRENYNSNTFGYQFSDANILAIPQREGTRAGAEFVAIWCRLLAREYFRAGLLVRGGVTIGKIFCTQSVCFGPALTRAYKLEQSAVQPMIIVDPDSIVQRYFLDEGQYGSFSNEGPFTYNLFAKTSDNRLFIDFLRPDACTNQRFRPLDVFNEGEIAEMLARFEIRSSDPLDVREKKCWLQRYATGEWRANSQGEFRQTDFQPVTSRTRRRLTLQDYARDFGQNEA